MFQWFQSGGVVATFESRKQITGFESHSHHRSWDGCAKDSIGPTQSLPVDSAEWSGNRDWGLNEEGP